MKQPLSSILRPKTISEVIGQSHLLGPNMPIKRMIERKKLKNFIIWGPPGVGKTTIAQAIANDTGCEFVKLNATEAKVDDLRKAAKMDNPVVFLDEIHRLSKSQQDVLLPMIENGTITLIGATTENPKFAVNSTILSRVMAYECEPLAYKEMLVLMKRAKDYYAANSVTFTIDKEAIDRMVTLCSGDARKLVTLIETVVEVLSDGHISVELVNMAMPSKHIVFDKSGNDHFDLAHCYQESIQHSDVDGAIYWLAKWLSSGEDPAYICRRMMITAAEDCSGNPHAMPIATAAHYITERTGMPECAIAMGQATIEMAKSERKKHGHDAIKAALNDVQNNKTISVPKSMRAGTNGIEKFGIQYVFDWCRDNNKGI